MNTRTELVAAELDGYHFPTGKIQKTDLAPRELIVLDSSWSLRFDTPSGRLTEIAREDFQTWLEQGFGFRLPQTETPSGRQLVFRAESNRLDFDRQDPEIETFSIEATEDQVVIHASHERGILQATHYLERTFREYGLPAFAPGKKNHTPAFMPRISNGVFIPNHQSPTAPGQFTDSYLSLMSHYGVNGIHLYINLYKICRSTLLPELNTADFEEQTAALNQHCQRLLDHGIDLYLHMNTPPLEEDHPVFVNHPEILGSRVEIFMDHVTGRKWHNLCSHSAKTLAFYTEAFQSLFNACPHIAGTFIIVGGECFFHCYTRPLKQGKERTNCPTCKDLDPDLEIANLANTLANALKSTGKHKSLYAWPYSAFVWSGEDDAQLGWIRHLSDEVSVLSNYDCGVPDPTCGNRAWLFDYNIKLIEPSSVFARQQEALAGKNQPIFVKTETNTTPDAFSLPYLPLHFRWIERFRTMQQRKIPGLVGQWRFYGMNATPPEEWQYQIAWNSARSNEEILRRWIRTHLEVTDAQVPSVLEAWRDISESWEDYPYSAMTSGERQAYMRGPMYIGPAQPLIFDVQSHYNLDKRFWLRRGDAGEMGEGQENEDYRRNLKPRYISDLLTVVPFGVSLYLEKLEACIQRMEKGFGVLSQILEPAQTVHAQRELDVVQALLIQLKTLRNVIRFYHTRDALYQKDSGPGDFQRYIEDLSAILREEIANAESALPILKRQPSVGYGHCYTEAYDYDLVADKIRQCRYVLDKELPLVSAVVRFHLWLDF